MTIVCKKILLCLLAFGACITALSAQATDTQWHFKIQDQPFAPYADPDFFVQKHFMEDIPASELPAGIDVGYRLRTEPVAVSSTQSFILPNPLNPLESTFVHQLNHAPFSNDSCISYGWTGPDNGINFCWHKPPFNPISQMIQSCFNCTGSSHALPPSLKGKVVTFPVSIPVATGARPKPEDVPSDTLEDAAALLGVLDPCSGTCPDTTPCRIKNLSLSRLSYSPVGPKLTHDFGDITFLGTRVTDPQTSQETFVGSGSLLIGTQNGTYFLDVDCGC